MTPLDLDTLARLHAAAPRDEAPAFYDAITELLRRARLLDEAREVLRAIVSQEPDRETRARALLARLEETR